MSQRLEISGTGVVLLDLWELFSSAFIHFIHWIHSYIHVTRSLYCIHLVHIIVNSKLATGLTASASALVRAIHSTQMGMAVFKFCRHESINSHNMDPVPVQLGVDNPNPGSGIGHSIISLYPPFRSNAYVNCLMWMFEFWIHPIIQFIWKARCKSVPKRIGDWISWLL